jgi:DNA invertase Pin-like site-specific DNA recombinase
VIYTRISAADDDSASTASQDAELRALAAEEGWDIVRAFNDEGVSGGVQRAQATEALNMLQDGAADILGVYAYDRWSRQGVEYLAELLKVLRLRREAGNPARFVAIRENIDGDGSEDDFELRLSISADMARRERERAKARMRAAAKYRHENGRHTGGPPPFGYRTQDAPGGGKVLVIDPDEAEIVRGMASRFLDDVGVSTLARELRTDGVPTPKSAARIARTKGLPEDGLDRGVWDATTVRRILTSDRIAGRVTHKGRLVTDADGLPVTFWEPVLSPDVVERIRARLAPASRPIPPRRAERLLSGVAYCATCGGRLWAGTVRNGVPVYRCPGRGCARPAFMRAVPLEDFVTARFLSMVGDWPEVEVVESVDTSVASALADIERAIDQVLADMRERDADRLALAERLDALYARADALRALPPEVTREVRPTGRTLREAWDAAKDDHERRRALTHALDHVAVAPNAAPTGRRVNFDRVAFYWNDGPEVNVDPDEGESRGPSRRRAPEARRAQ